MYVGEEILWGVLKKYKGYFINEPVRIYHTEQDDSFTNQNIRTSQYFVDLMWNNQYILNNYKLYKWGIKKYVTSVSLYTASAEILKIINKYPSFAWVFEKKSVCFTILNLILKLPTNVMAHYYLKKKGIK